MGENSDMDVSSITPEENETIINVEPIYNWQDALDAVQRAEGNIIGVLKQYAKIFQTIAPDFLKNYELSAITDTGETEINHQTMAEFNTSYDMIINLLNQTQALLRLSFSFLENMRLESSSHVGSQLSMNLSGREVDTALKSEIAKNIMTWINNEIENMTDN